MGITPNLSIEQQRLLDLHLQLVLEENKKSNLTRITNWEEAQLLHIEDSLVAFEELQAAPEGLYADLGSGAGYPGIPLAIFSKRKTLLIESVAKKAEALNRIVEQLNLLDKVSIYNGRAEELALEKPNAFSVLSARALSSLPSLLELGSPLLKIGGHFICYKASIEDTELQLAIQLEDKLGMRLISNRKVILSDNVTKRSIILFEKVSEPTAKLPRRSGMAQKRPYKP